MKKILIPIFGLLVLPLAAPSFAKFYSVSDSAGERSEQRDSAKDARAIFGNFALHAGRNYDRDLVPRDQYRLWQRHRFDRRGASTQEASETAESLENTPQHRQLSKAERKELRNSAYHKPGSSAGSSGSRHQGGSSNKPSSHSKGSRGSKGTKWLSKDNRKQQLDTYKRIMRNKHPGGSRGSKGSSANKHDRPVKHMLGSGYGKSNPYTKDFWSKKDFDKAMLCWLAPHLHEDKKFVNRYWNKWGYKWKWIHKYYKHKFHKHKYDKPPEIPLPASGWLMGTALLGLAAIGKRRHR